MRLEKSENKSRNITSGRSLRLSSIDGWTADKLPKLLIVWNFEKTSTDAFPSLTRPGKFSKKRDIEAIVDSYEMYLITEEDVVLFRGNIKFGHSDLVRLDWTQEWHDELKIVASDLNQKYSQRPINFQLVSKMAHTLDFNTKLVTTQSYQNARQKLLKSCHLTLILYLASSLD